MTTSFWSSRQMKQALTLAALLLVCQAVSAGLYGKPFLTFKSFFAPSELELHDVMKLSEEHWQELDEDIHTANIFKPDYVSANQETMLWLKIELPRRGDERYVWLELSPNVGLDGRLAQYIDNRWQWYQPEGIEPNKTGRRPVNFLTFVVDTQSSERVAYLKLNTSLVYHFKITTRTYTEFVWHAVTNNLFNGFILGFLCLAIIYNLAIGMSAGEKIYLYYSFYVTCNTLYISIISGYLRLIFPEWGGLGSMGNLGASLVLFSAIIFVREFLSTESYAPHFDKVLRILQAAMFATLLFVSFINEFAALLTTVTLGSIAPIVVLLAALQCLRNGHPYAKYFLVAWSFFLSTVFIWVAMWAGVFEPNTFTTEVFKVGTVLEITLLSLVLAYRYSFLKDQTEQLREARKAFKTLSETDELTGVLNRRGFLKMAEEILADRSHDCVWLALDVDHFKQFNDKYGHMAGDHLLAEFGNILDTNRRREDLAAKLLSDHDNTQYRRAIAGRIGGEEFAVLLTDCTIAQGKLYAERLVEEFAELLVEDLQGQQVGTTLSVGATRLKNTDTLESVWKRADQLLYVAKKAGRNTVAID